MLINPIASGSSGNAIIIDDGESKLLLDAGISYKQIAKWIRPTKLAGVLVTHEHGDHAKAAGELVRRGVDTYMSKGTCRALFGGGKRPSGIKSMGLNPEQVGIAILEHNDQVDIGSWKVLPFDVVHDSAEPMGFLVQSEATGEKLVYIVDSGLVQYNFQGVTHWLLECNYSEPLLEAGPYEEPLKDRVRQNHFSFEDLKTFLGDSDLSETDEIYLLHLSDANSDEQAFKQEVQKLTGVPVYTISDAQHNDLQNHGHKPRATRPGHSLPRKGNEATH